jgi:AraC-like DNA-binding protein
MYDHARLFVRLAAALARDPGASLACLSRGLRIHPHTLAQVIRGRTGVTFSEWRARQRIADACTLLRTRPDLSIKEVSAAAGFSSTSVFDRFLRRTCGRSPSQCRLAEPASSPRGPCAGAIVNLLDAPSSNDGVRGEVAGCTLESSTASS